MNTLERQEQLDRFLSGSMPGPERADFIVLVKRDRELARLLELETSLDAQFYMLSWGIQAVPGLETGKEWFALAGLKGENTAADIFSPQEWRSLLEESFAAAHTAELTESAQKKHLLFPRPLRYLAAACLIGVVAGVAALGVFRISKQKHLVEVVAISHVSNGAASMQPATDGKLSERRTSIIFDSLTIYSAQRADTRPMRPDTRAGIVRIGPKTAILLEKNASVSITSHLDSAIGVSMQSGTALYTVEKNRYRCFTVATPASEIRVTGTIFRLTVDDETTVLSVLEGSVRSRRNNDTSFITVPAGMSARITRRERSLVPGDTSAMLQSQCNLLHDFLEDNGVWENNTFTRTGLTVSADSINRRFRTLAHAVAAGDQTMDSLVFRFVYQVRNSSMAGELLLDLSREYRRRGDAASALALLDSTVALSDNDHAAEALYRSANLAIGELHDLTKARNIVGRYLSRFPYDPRSFESLDTLLAAYWARGMAANADSVLLSLMPSADPSVRLERSVFSHAEKLRLQGGNSGRALDWYSYLSEHFPNGTFKARADEALEQCMVQQAIEKRQMRTHTIDEFLHQDRSERR